MWTEVKSELFVGVSASGTETNWQLMASGAPPSPDDSSDRLHQPGNPDCKVAEWMDEC